jgi:flagellar basal body-associated protein FliL
MKKTILYLIIGVIIIILAVVVFAILMPSTTVKESTESEPHRVDGSYVDEAVGVSCNKDSDCSSGEVCIRFNDPSKNKCVEQGTGGSPICGDKVCESNEISTCPRDCSAN